MTRDLPLTGAQTGIWFAQRLDPTSPTYNIGERIDITGPLAPELLVQAITEVVGEADALHVRFRLRDGEPRQVPVPPGERPAVAVTRVDLRDAPDPAQAAHDWMRRALATPIDLDHDPLFAHARLRLGETHHVWFHRYHHVVVDAFGCALIGRRAAALYAARLAFDVPPPRRFGSLADLVASDRAVRERTRTEDAAFWASRFPAPPVPASLGERPQRASATFLRRSATVPAAVVGRMEAAAREATARGHWPELVLAAVAVHVHRGAAGDTADPADTAGPEAGEGADGQ